MVSNHGGRQLDGCDATADVLEECYNETEASLQRSIEYVSAGRTTVIIAHRLSTIRNCDIIMVMDDGKIVEQGNHEKLVEFDGIYSKLWRVQTGQKP